MKTQVMYKYLGTNGVICSPVHLEDIYYIRMLKLTADKGCQLTKDGEEFYPVVTIPEAEVDEWSEVKGQR
jgi:hypothetical protein